MGRSHNPSAICAKNKSSSLPQFLAPISAAIHCTLSAKLRDSIITKFFEPRPFQNPRMGQLKNLDARTHGRARTRGGQDPFAFVLPAHTATHCACFLFCFETPLYWRHPVLRQAGSVDQWKILTRSDFTAQAWELCAEENKNRLQDTQGQETTGYFARESINKPGINY